MIRVVRDGEVWEHYGPGEDIPRRYVNEDRRRARAELARELREGGSTPARIRELTERLA